MQRIELSMKLNDQELEKEWKSINWKMIEKFVKRLQGRIFLATENRDFKKVRNLQKLAQRSIYFHLFAIKQVTVVNKGRKTPGVDGFICTTIRDRVILLSKLQSFDKRNYKPFPIKRVYIPKPNGEFRPLGIPTIFDRIVQMLFKLCLEPEYEQKFHQNSFGFRPGRSCQDAIELVKDRLKGYPEVYILEADLKGFFDNIPHKLILKHFPPIYQLIIGKWLKAGIREKGYLIHPKKGTPQGGIISPLLANLALNDLDHRYNSSKSINLKDIRRKITTIRYADDFVVISKSKSILTRIHKDMQHYVQKIGLQFNEAKTHIVSRSSGFDFLGFHFIKYPHSYLRVIPSRKSIKRVGRSIKKVIMENKQVKTDGLIYKVNSITKGWAMYFRYCRSWKAFDHLDNTIFRWIWKWCVRRHPKKGKRWIMKNYFSLQKGNKWRLSGEYWEKLYFSDIKRKTYHWKVGNRSPMNPKYRKTWESKPECNNSPQIM
ncbi:MAG: group II intron reverse transcriptase/maturase [Promethearchaeota archaeon]